MILVALGSNISFCGRCPQEIIGGALAAMDRILRVCAVSGLYQSPAWPDSLDPPFINAVARVETGIDPDGLLQSLHAIEAAFGRRRRRVNSPRTLDLDLIVYGDRLRDADRASALVLPHPRFFERDFVLAPLAEIAPGWRHPVSGETVEIMLARIPNRTARRID